MIKSMTKKMNNKKGFTLIELIVVIAILGILAAIAIPRLGGFRDSAEERAEVATARTISTSVTMYQAQYGETTRPLVADLTEYLSEGVTDFEVVYETAPSSSIDGITTPSGRWTPGNDSLD